MSQTKPMSGGCIYLYNSCQTLIIESGCWKTFPTPASNLIWHTETLRFESGCCKTLPTPAFRKKAVIAGVGKVLQHPQCKLEVYIDVDLTGAGPKRLYETCINDISIKNSTGARVKQAYFSRVLFLNCTVQYIPNTTGTRILQDLGRKKRV